MGSVLRERPAIRGIAHRPRVSLGLWQPALHLKGFEVEAASTKRHGDTPLSGRSGKEAPDDGTHLLSEYPWKCDCENIFSIR